MKISSKKKEIVIFENVRWDEFGLYLNNNFIGKFNSKNKLNEINKAVGILNINTFVTITLYQGKYHDWYHNIKGYDYPDTAEELFKIIKENAPPNTMNIEVSDNKGTTEYEIKNK